jgi:hypothetical protein
MDRSNFINVATNSNDSSKLAWTDEELLEAIQVLQCLVAYFSTRKEFLIAHALRLELMSMEGYANARKWRITENDTWQIRKKDGTLAIHPS